MTVDTPPRPQRPAGGRPAPRRSVQRRRRVVALLGGSILALATVVGIILGTRPSGPSSFVSTCTAGSSGAGSGGSSASTGSFVLGPEQAQNAAIIAAVAYHLRLPDHAVTVALATALQESGLVDIPYGDLDSVGLFQQRPSQGWGTRAQLLDPVFAAQAFYDRLVQVSGWATLPVTEAAQAVQRSADPSAYADWESEARALAIALTGETAGGFACHLDGFTGPAPAASALPAAAVSELGASLIGTTVATKAGWQIASWAVAHAWEYHLAVVSFEGWRWTAASGRWVGDPGTAPATGTVEVVSGDRASGPDGERRPRQ